MDWIESFLAFTEGINSPRIFRLWTGITTLAGALQRRCWIEIGQGNVYPNLYVMLVAPPGIGKSESIGRAAGLWRSIDKIHVAPDSITAAALIDALEEANVKEMYQLDLLSFHALACAAGEFSVLMPKHDAQMLGTLTHIYDNPPEHKERRRGNAGKDPTIPKPSLTILAGAQPAFLTEVFPEYVWGQGFTARLIMIYSAASVKLDIFAKRQEPQGLREKLRAGLERAMELIGPMEFTEEAISIIRAWVNSGLEPVPIHSRLVHYNTRRLINTLKLSMIAAASRFSREISLEDFNRARNWLLEAEVLMPDIFRDMSGKSDRMVLDDLHSALWALYAKTGQKPIHEARLFEFLRTKVPADKMLRILEAAERSGMIIREAGTESPNARYSPAPLEGIQGLE